MVAHILMMLGCQMEFIHSIFRFFRLLKKLILIFSFFLNFSVILFLWEIKEHIRIKIHQNENHFHFHC